MMKPHHYRTIQGAAARLLAASALLLAAPAWTQTPAQPDPADPDAVLIEELVVVGREPGPAWWRVQDADTTVFVLGVPTISPKGQDWDRAGLERRLDGANELILGLSSAMRVSVAAIPGALIGYLKVKSSKPYEERLAPPLKARFVAMRERVGQPAKRYRFDNGVMVGLVLFNDFNMKEGLTTADPGKTIRRMAQARKVKVTTLPIPGGRAVDMVMKAPKAAQADCLDDILGGVEAGSGGIRRAAVAWAGGDVPTALTAERALEKCMATLPNAPAVDAQMKADRAKAIADALKKPGHAVAVVELRPLLSQGGVLDRLRSRGFTIKTPGGA